MRLNQLSPYPFQAALSELPVTINPPCTARPTIFPSVVLDQHQLKKNRRSYQNYLRAWRQAKELVGDSLNRGPKNLVFVDGFDQLLFVDLGRNLTLLAHKRHSLFEGGCSFLHCRN